MGLSDSDNTEPSANSESSHIQTADEIQDERRKLRRLATDDGYGDLSTEPGCEPHH